MSASRVPWALAAAGVGFALVGLFVWKKGGVQGAAEAIAGGAVNAAKGATTGALDAVSNIVGIPTTKQVSDDPKVARWMLDTVGMWETSFWCTPAAIAKAWTMDAGTGTAPPMDSAMWGAVKYQANAVQWTAYTQSENDRLLARYPAPASAQGIYAGVPTSQWEPWMFGRRPGEL